MSDFDDLIRDLRNFNQRRAVVTALRTELRQEVPPVRAAIRARALATLPRRGGLNKWVARARINAAVRVTGQTAGISLVGGRNSKKKRSDLKGLDEGRVRHPSWGRRQAGNWHLQTVPAGFFTKPAAEVDDWRQAADRAVRHALETIHA